MFSNISGRRGSKFLVSLSMMAIVTISQAAPFIYNASEITSYVSEKTAVADQSEQASDLSDVSSETTSEAKDKAESKSAKKAEGKSAKKAESKSAKKAESKSAKKAESKSAKKAGSKSAKKAESKSKDINKKPKVSDPKVNTTSDVTESENNSDDVQATEGSDASTRVTSTNVDVSNALFSGNISYKGTSNSGLYTVPMNNVNERTPDAIQGGETITVSLTDPEGAPNTCTNPDVSPFITPNSDYTEGFENTLTGAPLNDVSSDGTSITFTFNSANSGFLLNLGQAIFAWDIDIDDSLRGQDFPCGINTVITDSDGTELVNDTQQVVFNEPIATTNYIPVDWSLSDKYAKHGNIISPGSSVVNRQDLDSGGYYEANGAEDPKGGIVDSGARYVGNRISLNNTNHQYPHFSDAKEMSATFTLPQETTLMEDTIHIDATSFEPGSKIVEVTSLLHSGFLTYDDSTKTATFTMTKEDFDNIESELGIDMSDPTIYIYFEEKINKFSVKPQLDNFIYGSASIFDTDPWASEVDALDGYPNEGRVVATLTDYNDSTLERSTRLAYQEIDDNSGIIRDPKDPTLVGTVTDDNETEVEANKNSTCTPTQVYDFKYQLYDNYVFKQTMGEITITLPEQVDFNLDDVTFKLNGEVIDATNDYFTAVQDGNSIVITGTEYNEDNTFEMNYGVIDVSIPVNLVDISVGDSFAASSSWVLDDETYQAHDVITSIFDCDPPIDPTEAETVVTKDVADENGDGIIQPGEKLNYTISITNEDPETDAHDVEVRDSILENLSDYDYLTFNDDVAVAPAGIDTTGKLSNGNFTITTVAADSTVTITYSLTMADSIPADVENIDNIVTDNGKDPLKPVDPDKPEVICPEGNDDCGESKLPVQNTTVIKDVEDENGDGVVTPGETLNYTLTVTNESADFAAVNVPVRDSILENLSDFPYLTYNDDATIEPSTLSAIGDLTDGSYVITSIPAADKATITYSLTIADEIPNNVGSVLNIATDDNTDPNKPVDPSKPEEICKDDEDCDAGVLPVDPETVVTKDVKDGNGDGYAQPGETLTYTINVENPNTEADALDVAIRDSILENLSDYDYLTYNNDATLSPSTLSATGDLSKGTYVIESIPAGSTAKITYTMTLADSLPADVGTILNIATDDSTDPNKPVDPDKPDTVCEDSPANCGDQIISVDADTTVEKTMTDDNDDGLVQAGETLNYQLKVTNESEAASAYDVLVRDSLLESTPDYLTYNDDLSIDPSTVETSGDITAGTFTVAEVTAGQTVTLSYSLTVGDTIPSDVTTVDNIATDNGQDPTDPDFVCEDGSDDCATATEPVETETEDKIPTDKNPEVDTKVDTKVDNKEDTKVDTKVDNKEETKVDTKEETKVDTKEETKEKVKGSVVNTGSKTMLLVICLTLIAIVSMTLKKRLN